MSTRTRHIREFVETLAGPAIYVVYFGLAYFTAALACTLADGAEPLVADGADFAMRAALALALGALGAVGVVAVDAARRLSPAARRAEDNQDVFMALLTLALAALSALAILWTGMTGFFVPACT